MRAATEDDRRWAGGQMGERADSIARGGHRRAVPPARARRGPARVIGLAVGVVALLAVIVLGVMLIVVPKIAGATPLTILTSSMEPHLPPGTLVVVRPVDADDLAVGDVVTYQIRSGEPEVITHRIISISAASTGERTFELQGDNNADPDPDPVVEAQVQGRVWYSVPIVGWVNIAVNGENRAWIVPVLAVAAFGYAGWMFASGLVSTFRRRPKTDRRSRAAD